MVVKHNKTGNLYKLIDGEWKAKINGKCVDAVIYQGKEKGRYVLVYTNQCFKHKDSTIKLKGANGAWYEFYIDKENLQQVRLIPKGNHIVVEIIYNVEYELKEDNNRYASLGYAPCAVAAALRASVLLSSS